MITLRCWTAPQKALGKLNNVSTGTLWNSRKTNTNFSQLGRKNPLQQHQVSSGQLGTALQEGTWASWWAASSTWALCALAAAPGLHKQGQGRSHHLPSTCQTTQILCPEQDKLEQIQERATMTVRGQSISPPRRGWENQAHSAWKEKDFSIMIVQGKLLKTKPGSSLWSMDGGWERTGMSWKMGSSDWV